MGWLGDVVRGNPSALAKHHLGYDQTKYVVEQVRRGTAPFVPTN